MPTEEIAPARLYFLIARDSHKAVIFRRGPSEWTQIISWDLKTDEMQYGQRFHGRIYEMRSDISPNGEFLIYFAAKYGKTNKGDYETTWTAISRIPCLTALCMWPLGHTWYGGGFFRSDEEIMLNHIKESSNPHPNHLPKKTWTIICHENREFISSDFLYMHILSNHGWTTVPSHEKDSYIMEKMNGMYLLRWERRLKNFTFQNFFSIDEGGQNHVLENVAHADWDHNGRLLIAKEGCLFASQKNRPPYDAGSWNMIADLNIALPHIGKAPEFYTRW